MTELRSLVKIHSGEFDGTNLRLFPGVVYSDTSGKFTSFNARSNKILEHVCKS